MAITFDEVTADIQPAGPIGGSTAGGAADGAAQPSAAAEGPRERLEADLRLLAERAARHCAD